MFFLNDFTPLYYLHCLDATLFPSSELNKCCCIPGGRGQSAVGDRQVRGQARQHRLRRRGAEQAEAQPTDQRRTR